MITMIYTYLVSKRVFRFSNKSIFISLFIDFILLIVLPFLWSLK